VGPSPAGPPNVPAKPTPKWKSNACVGSVANFVMVAAIDYLTWGELGKIAALGQTSRFLREYQKGIISGIIGLRAKTNTAARLSRPVAATMYNFSMAGMRSALTGEALSGSGVLLSMAVPFAGTVSAGVQAYRACAP
jgi:hypothetical protein